MRAKAAFLLVAAAIGGSAAPSDGATPATRPNVVVVMADDQTVESMRVMSNVNALLGREGVAFANSFASFPLCCPSRATYVTGQYAHNHTIMGNAAPQGGYEKLAPTHANTLPAWLRSAGYHTIHIGKYLNGYGRLRPTEVPAGWAEWYGSVDPSTYQFYNYTLNENGRLVRYGATPQEYQADVYTAKAVDAVRRLAPQQQPFFLSVAYLAPHSGGPREAGDPPNQATPVPAPRHRDRFAGEPMPVDPSFNEADVSDKPAAIRRRPLLRAPRVAGITENYRQRLESLLAVDEGVASIVRALADAGELDNTVFLYTADNGFFHGEHRVPAGKVMAYEPSARVPLLMRGPGVPKNVTIAQPVVNVDLAATILDAADARAGRVQDGFSLIAMARDRTRFIGRDVLLETPSYAAIHTPRYVYVEHTAGDRELYDLSTDRYQLSSKHADAALAAVRTRLAARLAVLRRCVGATCRRGPALALTSRCVGRAHRLTLAGGDTAQVTRVDWMYQGRSAGADRRSPFQATLPRAAGLVRGIATLDDGRRASVDRRVAACR